MLTAQFGLSIFGIAATVAAFLLGLGRARCWPRGTSQRCTAVGALRRYAALEVVIALYALALPALSAAGAPLLDAAAPRLAQWQWYTLQGGVAVFLLALPAAAMGASFPLVLRALPPTPRVLGRIYAANTLGAATGAVLGLALLATIGWSDALRAIALLGGVVAAAAAWLGSRAAADAPPSPPAAALRAGWGPPGLLLAYAGVGAAALMLEITWTRLYGMVLLRTEYVLAVILAVYLVGTALGSALAARGGPLAGRRDTAGGVRLHAGGHRDAGAPERWLQGRHFDALATALAVQSLALCLCTLPTTVALGAWLPVLARRAGGADAPPTAGAALYASNCLGGALGTAATVALLIPALGTVGTLALAAVLLLALGLGLGAPRRVALALPLAVAAAVSLHRLPPPARMLGAGPSQERYRYEDALTLTQVIENPDGQRVLLTDMQHLDASSDPAAVQLQADQARLPLLLHAAPRSVLFLGLGTGISASGSLAYPGLARSAVEISAGAVVAAHQWFAPVNGGVMAVLHVDRDDARHFLAATAQRYDVIVGDLFHPDVAGSGNLLSVEQFARARACLATGGIFAQWIALNQFDRESLHIVMRSFQAVFPQGQLFLDGAHMALVGRASRGIAPAGTALGTGAEGRETWLGRYWGPIAAGIGPLQREARPVIEFRLPRLRYDDGNGPMAQILRELLRQRPDAATAARQLGIAPTEQDAFAGAYAASELALQAWLAVLDGDAARARELVRLAFEANPQDRWIASNLADDLWQAAIQDGRARTLAGIERVLRVYPDHVDALRALWHLERSRDAGGARTVAALARLRAVAPLDGEVRTIGVPLP